MQAEELQRIGEEAAASGPHMNVETDRARDTAALASMAWAIAELSGGGSTMDALPPLPAEHGSIVRRWFDELRAAGWLHRDGWNKTPPSRSDVADAWALAEETTGGALTGFFARCAMALPQLLTGEVQVHGLLFDDDATTTEIYQTNEASRYTNAVAAAELRHRCRTILAQARTPTVLEIGGGVGGTTDVIFAAVTDLPLRYHFTDVSDWFTMRAQQRWAGRSGLTTGLLDINDDDVRRREALGSLHGEFDIVLAANVMHNATDVPRSLRSIASHCRPEAQLLLIETGTEHLPLLISMRFLMSAPPASSTIGGERASEGRILLTTGQWSQALDSDCWRLRHVLPGPRSTHPVARYDQHVWIALRAQR